MYRVDVQFRVMLDKSSQIIPISKSLEHIKLIPLDGCFQIIQNVLDLVFHSFFTYNQEFDPHC